jgi:hypothetical protein
MTGSFAGGQRNIPDLDRVALANRAVDLHGRKSERRFFPAARIVATFEQRLVGFACDKLGSTGLFQFGEAAGVIDMRVGVEEVFDVGDLEIPVFRCSP